MIHEVGPREGFQFEQITLPTEIKAEFIEALARTGLKDIEVASFVRSDVVPQMADAESLVAKLTPYPNVTYTGTYLNVRGLERASRTGKLRLKHGLTISASETFSQRNQHASHQEAYDQLAKRADIFRDWGIGSVSLGVAAAFGCNFEGDIALSKVLDWIRRLEELAFAKDLEVDEIRLLDTMGWANPKSISESIEAIHGLWPGKPISLHLHDTRGLGMANAYAALLLGVSDFDTAVAGLGGCPFADHKGAAGNIATEDFVLLCQEMGIETEVDLDALIKCALMAEVLVGHPLPGKVKAGGNLNRYRQK
ncbi:MAG: hydroxymethylglutaryl-CoA lyase [Actinomycetota bacterium]|nr:MAG: hydroxymethylglutaryl-CoA lyase [Actinomycetota bacterium]